MPDVIETFAAEAEALRSVAQEWVDLTGKQDSNVAQMNQLAYQLDEMADDPDQIPALYSQFKDSLSTFANLLLDVKKQPLLLDYLFVSEAAPSCPARTQTCGYPSMTACLNSYPRSSTITIIFQAAEAATR